MSRFSAIFYVNIPPSSNGGGGNLIFEDPRSKPSYPELQIISPQNIQLLENKEKKKYQRRNQSRRRRKLKKDDKEIDNFVDNEEEDAEMGGGNHKNVKFVPLPPFSSSFHTIQPTRGQLIIFPSWLSHKVETVTSSSNNKNNNKDQVEEEKNALPRISISYNIVGEWIS